MPLSYLIEERQSIRKMHVLFQSRLMTDVPKHSTRARIVVVGRSNAESDSSGRGAGRDCVGQIGSKRLYAPTDRAADDKAISGDNSVDGRRQDQCNTPA